MAARGLADYAERKHSPFMKPGPPDGTAFTLPATGIEAPALDTRERLRQISLEAGVEVEHGVDSPAQDTPSWGAVTREAHPSWADIGVGVPQR